VFDGPCYVPKCPGKGGSHTAATASSCACTAAGGGAGGAVHAPLSRIIPNRHPKRSRRKSGASRWPRMTVRSSNAANQPSITRKRPMLVCASGAAKSGHSPIGRRDKSGLSEERTRFLSRMAFPRSSMPFGLQGFDDVTKAIFLLPGLPYAIITWRTLLPPACRGPRPTDLHSSSFAACAGGPAIWAPVGRTLSPGRARPRWPC
jgi:hypothetical protein